MAKLLQLIKSDEIFIDNSDQQWIFSGIRYVIDKQSNLETKFLLHTLIDILENRIARERKYIFFQSL